MIIIKIDLISTQSFIKENQEIKALNCLEVQKKDKLKALNLAKELADQSTLPILRRGLKDMNPEIVELSASLIEKFK